MKKRDTRHETRDTKKHLVMFFAIFILLISYLLSPISINAQTASPSGTLLQKLNELKSEIASKAAEIKNDINKKIQDKAVIGSILKIEDEQIIIQGLNNTKTVKYDEFTEILGLGGKKITIKTLEENDNIAALGDVDDKNNLVAQRLVYLENFASNSAQLVWGQIEKTAGSSITLKDRSGEKRAIATTAQTVFYLGNNEASIQDAKPEKFMVARGTRLKDGSLRARFIYFIPSVGFIKPEKKTASPSAQVSKKQMIKI